MSRNHQQKLWPSKWRRWQRPTNSNCNWSSLLGRWSNLSLSKGNTHENVWPKTLSCGECASSNSITGTCAEFTHNFASVTVCLGLKIAAKDKVKVNRKGIPKHKSFLTVTTWSSSSLSSGMPRAFDRSYSSGIQDVYWTLKWHLSLVRHLQSVNACYRINICMIYLFVIYKNCTYICAVELHVGSVHVRVI